MPRDRPVPRVRTVVSDHQAEAFNRARSAAELPEGRQGSLRVRADEQVMRKLTVYLPDELVRELAVHCARVNRSRSSAVQEATERWLAAALRARGR